MTATKNILHKTPLWAHSWYCNNGYNNAVGVKEKIMVEYDDGSIEYLDNLRIRENPVRPFWITKPQYRNYSFKKEFEDIDKCDMYRCRDSEIVDKLEGVLGLTSGYRKRSLRQLCNNPYVYGADIDIQTLIKQAYVKENTEGRIPVFTKGGLDIEAEVVGQKRINVLTFIHGKFIYTAAMREYCKIHETKEKFRMATHEDCLRVIDERIGDLISDYTLEFKIFETDLEIIEWIFKKIHFHKTDFIGIWNMDYDMPKILSRIESYNIEPQSIMCHPDVPRQFRFAEWREDKSDSDHFTDKWHTASISGYTRFLDFMCLYSRLRKTSGRLPSYGLDAISKSELGIGKDKMDSAITNHWYSQNYQFLEYIAYNIKDVLLMCLMEEKNHDIDALIGLTGMSRIEQFARQTTMVRNSAYAYGRARGKVIASTGTSNFTDYDNRLPKEGGAVLPPNKAVNVGVAVVSEFPDWDTQVSLFTNDLDVSSMYPSITSAFNISKETALATVFVINGFTAEDVETYFSGITRPDINAVPLAAQFYGLPNYSEMSILYSQYLRTSERVDGKKIVVNG